MRFALVELMGATVSGTFAESPHDDATKRDLDLLSTLEGIDTFSLVWGVR